MNTSVYKTNVSLAIQLSMDWLIRKGLLPKDHNRMLCTEKITSGIGKFNWPGRYQIIERGQSRFYLDGAHTLESIHACLEWFRISSRQIKDRSFKCLLFFVTGTRNVQSLAQPIVDSKLFDLIVVCPNVVDAHATIMDNVTANVTSKDLDVKCCDIQRTFQEIGFNSAAVRIAPSVTDGLQIVEKFVGSAEVDVLITGSLYLVGSSLIALNQERTPIG